MATTSPSMRRTEGKTSECMGLVMLNMAYASFSSALCTAPVMYTVPAAQGQVQQGRSGGRWLGGTQVGGGAGGDRACCTERTASCHHGLAGRPADGAAAAQATAAQRRERPTYAPAPLLSPK